MLAGSLPALTWFCRIVASCEPWLPTQSASRNRVPETGVLVVIWIVCSVSVRIADLTLPPWMAAITCDVLTCL